jgi:hypothetical protein
VCDIPFASPRQLLPNFLEASPGITPPTTPTLVPKMAEEDYPRGNVRHYPNGTTVSIEADAADNIHFGRRHQRPGLLYSENHPGFYPCTWPCVVSPPLHGGVGSYRLLLQPREGEALGETVVDVCYRPGSDDRLLGWAQLAMAEHVPCRTGGNDVGTMVGVGDHLLRDGRLVHYKTLGEVSRRAIASMCEAAGGVFRRHFGGRGAGFEHMLATQQRIWPQQKRPIGWPLCWDASVDLGNSAHIDMDGERSFAWWGRTGEGSSSWWFLIPEWGVAIALDHDTWISWDGRVQRHCTSVPLICEGDHFYSLFCSLPAALLTVRERVISCVQTMQGRSAGELVRGGELFEQLREHMCVSYRVSPVAPPEVLAGGKNVLRRWVKKHTRWALARVERITETHVLLRDENSARTSVWLSKLDVSNRVVIV